MAEPSLIEIARRLEEAGVDAGELRELQDELELLDRPPRLLSRLASQVRNAAAKHWGNLLGELRESREAMDLIATRVSGQRKLTPEEADKIREQLLDLVKTFPAGVIAAANSAFPIPGTGLLTPWILARLGLMPSHWREAHLLDQLRRQQVKLRAGGHAHAASELDGVRHQVEQDAAKRDRINHAARLLTHWDANANGVWDADERAKYAAEVLRLRALATLHGQRKRWFLDFEGEVFGPVRLTELDPTDAGELLACYSGGSGWVTLGDLLGDEHNRQDPSGPADAND